jgi:hypothetical protein
MGYALVNNANIIFYAGVGSGRTFFGDLWLYNFENNTWTNATVSSQLGAPLPRGSPSFAIYGNNTGIVVCQGGTYGYSVADLNPTQDMWVLRIDGVFNGSLTGNVTYNIQPLLLGTISTGENAIIASTGNNNLSDGAAVGIAFGVIAFVAILVTGIFLFWRRYSNRRSSEDVEMDTTLTRIQAIKDVQIMERVGGGNFGSVCPKTPRNITVRYIEVCGMA